MQENVYRGLHDQKQQNANRQMAARAWIFELLSCLKVECEISVAGSVQIVWVRSDSVERRLLTSSYLSVCPYVSAGLCLNGFLWNFVLGILWKSGDKIEISLISNKISALCMKPSVSLISVGESKWPQTVLLQWSDIRHLR